MSHTEECVICGVRLDDGVTISRCCCDQDFVCQECADTKSLADYIAKAVSIL